MHIVIMKSASPKTGRWSTLSATSALLSALMVTTAHAAGGVAGDVNDDFFVSCQDLTATQAAVGKRSGQPGFLAPADLDRNGLIMAPAS